MSVRLPTRSEDWRLMARTARLVLALPPYAAVGALAAAVALTGFVVSQNLALVSDVVVGGSLPVADRLAVLLGFYPLLGPTFGPLQSAVLLLVAGLTGVDVALVAYHLREHRVSLREGGGSAVGVLLGTLGAGCAACGSAVLAGLLSLVGATGLLTLLPLDGLEFALLAVVALLLSVHWLADGMRGGEIDGCPVDVRR
ncbi:MAG: hypothetical protein ABEJ34_05350 [Haloferacaceae archaeon]